jgi:hypothetical protein
MEVSMTITSDLRQAIENVGHAELTDPQTNETYVLIRKEFFSRMQGLVGLDAGPLSIEEQRALLAHAGRRAGWDDPAMDVYNELDPRRQS